MKKKIRDLTLEDRRNICNNIDYCSECSCKLFGTSKCVCFDDDEKLDQEIEVKEDE